MSFLIIIPIKRKKNVNPTFQSDSRYPKSGNHTSNFESGLKDDDGLKDRVVPGGHPSILMKSLHHDS